MSSALVNRNVLMLNQNYEPLSICSARRAIILLFQGKAEMIETANGLKLHSVRESWPLPSVVRLAHYKKVPYKRIMLTRKNILMRDGHRCQYCGTTRGPMTVDHIVPKTMGGSDSWDNLVCACVKCNNRKGDSNPEQVGMALQHRPTRPIHITFIQRYIGVQDDHWRQYLFMD